jgi:hypothetical protein
MLYNFQQSRLPIEKVNKSHHQSPHIAIAQACVKSQKRVEFRRKRMPAPKMEKTDV